VTNRSYLPSRSQTNSCSGIPESSVSTFTARGSSEKESAKSSVKSPYVTVAFASVPAPSGASAFKR